MRTFVILTSLTAGITLSTVSSLGQTPATNSQKNSTNTQTSQQQNSNQQSKTQRNTSQMKSTRAKNSSATTDLLAATNQALDAARRQDKTDALFHVNHALENANKVSGNTKLVPIYAELSEYSVLQPIMEAKNKNAQGQNTQQQSTQARNNQSKNSTSTADRSAQNAATVQRVTGEFTSVSLDVTAAKQHLEAARTALNSGDFDKAESALAEVASGLVTESVATDMPLLRARQNLIIGRDEAMEGNTQAAQAAFKEAGNALTEYGKTSTSHGQDAQKLKSEIDSFSQSLQKNTANVDSKVEGWWDQVTGWIPASASSSTSSTGNSRK